MRELYDVIEVDMKSNKVEVLDTLKSFKSADAIIKRMAAARRGTPHFFKAVSAGEYRDGERFRF